MDNRMYGFLKTLRRERHDGRDCFLYVETEGEKSTNNDLWQELRKDGGVVILKYDLRMLQGNFYTDYLFTFADESIGDAFNTMLDL